MSFEKFQDVARVAEQAWASSPDVRAEFRGDKAAFLVHRLRAVGATNQSNDASHATWQPARAAGATKEGVDAGPANRHRARDEATTKWFTDLSLRFKFKHDLYGYLDSLGVPHGQK